MLASAAIKNSLDGFPMTVAPTPVAYCKHNKKLRRFNTTVAETPVTIATFVVQCFVHIKH